MKFKRGDIVVDPKGFEGTILGPEDWEGYERNRPSSEWELVRWGTKLPNGKDQAWSASKWLKLKE